MATGSQPSRDLFTGVTVLAHKGTFKSFSCLSILLLPISVITGDVAFRHFGLLVTASLGKIHIYDLELKSFPLHLSHLCCAFHLATFLTFKLICFPLQHNHSVILHFGPCGKAVTRTSENINWTTVEYWVIHGSIFRAVQTKDRTLHATDSCQPWALGSRNSHSHTCLMPPLTSAQSYTQICLKSEHSVIAPRFSPSLPDVHVRLTVTHRGEIRCLSGINT